MNRRTAPIVPALAFALAASALAATAAPKGPEMSRDLLPFKATETTLPNGLKVIVVPTGFPNLVSLQIPVQTGSRNEVEPGKSGFAHFFEHMMFRGTKAYPPETYQAILTKAGARQNAYTTDDYTNYHTTFAKEDLEKVLEIEADRFQNLDYPEEAFKTESRAVLGEYNKNSANPMSKLFEVHARRAPSRRTPTSTRRWASSRTSRTCPTSSPTRRRSSTAGTGRSTRRSSSRATSTRRRSSRSSRSTGAPGSAAATRSRSPRSRRRRGRRRSTSPGRRRRCPGSSSPSTAPPSPTTAKDWAALDVLLDLAFGPTSDAYKKLVETEQKVDQLFPYLPASADPQLLTVGRAREEARGRRRTSATRSCRTFAALARRAGPGPRASPTPRRTPATASCGASTTRRRSPARSPATSATAARTTR